MFHTPVQNREYSYKVVHWEAHWSPIKWQLDHHSHHCHNLRIVIWCWNIKEHWIDIFEWVWQSSCWLYNHKDLGLRQRLSIVVYCFLIYDSEFKCGLMQAVESDRFCHRSLNSSIVTDVLHCEVLNRLFEHHIIQIYKAIGLAASNELKSWLSTTLLFQQYNIRQTVTIIVTEVAAFECSYFALSVLDVVYQWIYFITLILLEK